MVVASVFFLSGFLFVSFFCFLFISLLVFLLPLFPVLPDCLYSTWILLFSTVGKNLCYNGLRERMFIAGETLLRTIRPSLWPSVSYLPLEAVV